MDNGAWLERAIRDASDPLLIMNRIAEEALRLIPRADGSAIELLEGDVLTCVSCAGTMSRAVGERLRLDESLSGLALLRGEALRSDDTTTDFRVDRKVARQVGAASLVSVPLRRGDEPVGAVIVISSSPAAFDDRDVATLTGIADFITGTVIASSELSRITEELLASGHPGSSPASPSDAGALSTFVANVLHPGVAYEVEAAERIERVLSREIAVFFQPVVDLSSEDIVGVEALTRFLAGPYRAPDAWYAEAHRVGRGLELELAAVKAALRHADELPFDCFVAVNLGPEAVISPQLLAVLGSVDTRRVVIELTEHMQVSDYPLLRRSLMTLHERGVRLAIDDAGSGFASLSLIVELAPQIIKVDMALVRGIDFDPVRRSLVGAIVAVAGELRATVIAEGIETKAELDALQHLGVGWGQGYLLGRPGPLENLDVHRLRVGPRRD